MVCIAAQTGNQVHAEENLPFFRAREGGGFRYTVHNLALQYDLRGPAAC